MLQTRTVRDRMKIVIVPSIYGKKKIQKMTFITHIKLDFFECMYTVKIFKSTSWLLYTAVVFKHDIHDWYDFTSNLFHKFITF